MSLQCFSNILNPPGELIEQVPGDCPIPSEYLWVGFIQSTHGTRLEACWLHAHVCCVYVCVVCVYRCIYINSHLPIAFQAQS